MRRVLCAVLVACVLLSAGMAVPRQASALSPLPPLVPTLPEIPPIDIDLVATLNYRAIYTVPLYRMKLTQGSYSWHGYTSSESQRSYMKANGWTDAGIVAYVSPIKIGGQLPLFRWQYFGRVTWLTLDPEGGTAPSYGMNYTGIMGCVLPPSTPLASELTRVYQQIRTSSSFFLYDYCYTSSTSSVGIGYSNYGIKCTAWKEKTLLQNVTVSPFASGLTGKTSATIKWSTKAAGGVVELLYSTDNGSTWTSIAHKETNDGSYTWSVPNLTATDCRIMVKWSASASSAASAWAVGPKFGITKDLVFIPFTPIIPPITLFEFAPPAPSALTATAGTTEQSIQLSWVDNSATETGFAIERKTDGGTYALLTTTAADVVTYIDTTIAEGQEYVYRVRANGSTTNSDWSNEAAGVYYDPETPPEDLEPETPPTLPAAPTSLQATKLAGPGKSVQLSWTASTSTILGHKVERRTTGSWGEIADVGGTANTFVDTGITDPAVTEAAYRVLAYDEFGSSPPSNEAAVSWATSPEPEPEPEPETEPGAPVFDGTQSGWAEGELTLAYQNGLTYPGVMCDFGRKITREEFCTIAVRLYEKLTGLTAVPGPDPFDDTGNPDILKAYDLGIVRGVSANLFAPSNNITRQEICVMIFRALQAAGKSTLLSPGTPFPMTDAGEIDSWAINEVRFCHHNDIMRGMTPTTIVPLGNTTREQAIVLLWRTYDAFK